MSDKVEIWAQIGVRIANIRMTAEERARLKKEMQKAVSPSAYYNYLNDERSLPIEVAKAWAEVFGISIEALMNPLAQLPNPYQTNQDVLNEHAEWDSKR